ncbi:MAG: glycosyltransferase [Acidobacteriota bacterium]
MPEPRQAAPNRGGDRRDDSVEISALVVSWNTRDLLRECLHSILAAAGGASVEVIVVDNASEDGSAAMVESEFGGDPRVQLIANSENAGFARGCNQACAASRGEYLAVLNPDVVLRRLALESMVDYLRRHPEVGAVSCTLLGPDGKRQPMHRAFPTLGTVFFNWTRLGKRLDEHLLGRRHQRRYNREDLPRTGVSVIDQAPGACFVIPRALAAEIGGLFDEGYPIFFNDVDLSRRIWESGREIHVLNAISAFHQGRASLRQLPRTAREREFLDSLVRYFDRREPRWKRIALRALIAGRRLGTLVRGGRGLRKVTAPLPPPAGRCHTRAGGAPVRLNLGCNRRPRPGYINVDLELFEGVDVVADLEKPWPWADGSVDEIVCSDLPEHLRQWYEEPDPEGLSRSQSYADRGLYAEAFRALLGAIRRPVRRYGVIHFMEEANRVLKVGGRLDCLVPTTDARGWAQDPTHTSYWNENSVLYFTDPEYRAIYPGMIRGSWKAILVETGRRNRIEVQKFRMVLEKVDGPSSAPRSAWRGPPGKVRRWLNRRLARPAG